MEAFLHAVATSGWSVSGELTGTLVTSAAGMDLYVNPVHGTLLLTPSGSRLLVTAPDRHGTRVFEEVRTGGKRSVRGPDGIWRDEPLPADSADLVSILRVIGSVEVVGAELVNGSAATDLKVSRPIDLRTLGGVRAAVGTSDANLHVFVDATGRPVKLRLVPVAGPGGTPIVESVEIALRPIPAETTVKPPEAWTRQVSAHGYEILLPADCTPEAVDGHWEPFGCPSFIFRVWTYPGTTESLQAWADASVASWSKIRGVSPDLEDTLRVGADSDAVPGVIATYRYQDSGTAAVMSDALFVHGGTGFDVVMVGLADTSVSDRATFLQIVSTLRFSDTAAVSATTSVW
jgi:hypothetical protein